MEVIDTDLFEDYFDAWVNMHYIEFDRQGNITTSKQM
jgi:hypothetical protein